MIHRVAFFFLVVPLAGAARADDATFKLEEYMNACVKVHDFYGSVLVAKNGVLLSKGYGFANLEHQVPNSPKTKFRIGSITKQFTAMAILILEEQGKLKTSDPISKYIENSPQSWKDITIDHLLNHTSGVPSYTDTPGYVRRAFAPITQTKMIESFRDNPLHFKPGSRFRYSNSGYFLLGVVIEKVCGKKYEEFLREAIFDPLGMKDTGYDWYATVIPHRAAGYEQSPKGAHNAAYLDMTHPYSAGALYSTTDDLYRWDLALCEGKLISKQSYERMYTPKLNNYAYGWMVRTRGGKKEISHGGGINGFSTQILRIPEAKICVVVLSNYPRVSPGRVANELASILLGERYQLPRERKIVKVDPKIYEAYVGKYELRPNFVITITKENDRLMGQATGQAKVELFPESETDYFLKAVEAQISFVKDDKGTVTSLILKQGGGQARAKRL